MPLILSLWLPLRRLKGDSELAEHESPFDKIEIRRLAIALFWHLDIIGILLLIVIFSCILVPFTIAGNITGNKPQQWGEAKVIAPLVIGFLCIPVWLLWEGQWAKSSLLPFKVSQISSPNVCACADHHISSSRIAQSGVRLESRSCSSCAGPCKATSCTRF